ncbi:MAG: hypothetical protein ABWK00_01985 [Desulfurococcaceae archaeon]
MKGLSELLPTLIMAGVAMALLAIAYFYAMQSTWALSSSSRLEYARDALLAIAQNLDSVIQGGNYEISYPSRALAFGYEVVGALTIYVNGSAALSVPCASIYAQVPGQLVAEGVVYGSRTTIVNDTRLLAEVLARQEGGRAVVALDACRVQASVEVTKDRRGSFFYFNLLVVNLTPVLAGGAGGYIRLEPAGAPAIYTYAGVLNLTIVATGPAGARALGPMDIYPSYSGGPITVTVKVVNVRAVIA